jgi:DNA-binding transcriptional regulator GbsR (MarR family)
MILWIIHWDQTPTVQSTGMRTHEVESKKNYKRRNHMDLSQEFIDEFGKLSKDIQNNELQGKIQMFFRLIKPKVAQNELAERFGVRNADINAAMENFKILGVAEETEEEGLITYVFKGYSAEIKEIASLFPERQKRLETSIQVLEQLIERAHAEGQHVDRHLSVVQSIKADFGIG